MPDDKQQQTVDWQNDPDFHALPLADKHKVLLQVDPDYKGLPAKEQAKALDAIHYGSLGQISGEGVSTKGVGTGIWNTLKGMVPPDPTGGHPILSKEALLGTGPTFDPAKSGIAQMGKEASIEYSRARAAGAGPVAAGYSAAISGAGPAVGISDIQQQELASQGEGGQIIGQSAVPAALTLAGPAARRMVKGVPGAETPASAGGISADTTGAAGRYLLSKSGIPGSGYVGEKIGRLFGTPGAAAGETAESIPLQKRMAAHAEMTKDLAKKQAIADKAQAKADIAAAKAAAKVPPNPFPGASTSGTPSMTSPVGQTQLTLPPVPVKPAAPSPFSGMTSTAAPIGSAELPPVPQGQPTPFPMVTRKGGMAAPPTVEPPQTGGPLDLSPQPKTSVLSRAKTPIELGVEPDMNNPTHVKMINDIIGQGLNETAIKKLKVRANFGDRFAKVALDYWRSKEGR